MKPGLRDGQSLENFLPGLENYVLGIKSCLAHFRRVFSLSELEFIGHDYFELKIRIFKKTKLVCRDISRTFPSYCTGRKGYQLWQFSVKNDQL